MGDSFLFIAVCAKASWALAYKVFDLILYDHCMSSALLTSTYMILNNVQMSPCHLNPSIIAILYECFT